MNVATLQVKDNAIVPRLYIAMELSNKSWKVVFSDGVKRRRVTIEARHREQLREAIAKAKEKFRLALDGAGGQLLRSGPGWFLAPGLC